MKDHIRPGTLQRRDGLVELAEIGHNPLDIAKLQQAACCLARKPTQLPPARGEQVFGQVATDKAVDTGNQRTHCRTIAESL